jgi:hypothetical protein
LLPACAAKLIGYDAGMDENCPKSRSDPFAIVTLILAIGAMVLFCAGYMAVAFLSLACAVIGLKATKRRSMRQVTQTREDYHD